MHSQDAATQAATVAPSIHRCLCVAQTLPAKHAALTGQIEHPNHKTSPQSENDKLCSIQMGQFCTLLVSGAAHLVACNAL